MMNLVMIDIGMRVSSHKKFQTRQFYTLFEKLNVEPHPGIFTPSWG